MAKEYIEREAALRVLCDACGNAACPKGLIPRCSYYEKMQSIPAADVRPVRHGRWIDNKVAFYLGCSECGCYLEYAVDTFLDNGEHYHYCPNCGARMDGDRE